MTQFLAPIAVLVALGVALAAPVLLGMQLTKARPGWSPWLVAALCALPTGLPVLVFAAWIGATSEISPCETPPCAEAAPLWFEVMLALGVLALLAGFGLAWIGRFAAKKGAGKAKV